MNPLRILIRTDAGGSTGLGHFFRSKALGEWLALKGHSVLFVSQPSEFWHQQLAEGFPFRHWFLTPEITQYELVCNEGIDVLFVDGLVLFSKEEADRIKSRAKLIFYQNNTESYRLAHAFILPSLHLPSVFSGGVENMKLFQGLKYFTFNPQIKSLRRKNNIEKVASIALSAGGSDPTNALNRLMGLIDFKRFQNVRFNFYFGIDAMHAPLEVGQHNAKNHAFSHQEILKNDLLVTAFGVSAYEFIALGMPVVSFGHSQETTRAANALANLTGAVRCIGFIDVIESAPLNDELQLLTESLDEISQLQAKGAVALNLDGLEHVTSVIEELCNPE